MARGLFWNNSLSWFSHELTNVQQLAAHDPTKRIVLLSHGTWVTPGGIQCEGCYSETRKEKDKFNAMQGMSMSMSMSIAAIIHLDAVLSKCSVCKGWERERRRGLAVVVLLLQLQGSKTKWVRRREVMWKTTRYRPLTFGPSCEVRLLIRSSVIL